jgi:hypothetical protein
MSLYRPGSGELLRVKARSWDCESCGLDKRNKIALMCEWADDLRMLTPTLMQPAYRRGEPPPETHALCDPTTHVYEHHHHKTGRSTGERWRTLATCIHCCRRLSGMLVLFRKRLRRRWPSVEYLWSREDHKSGSIHVHMAMSGLPRGLHAKSRDIRWIQAQWRAVGGGRLDPGFEQSTDKRRVGWYLGKYLAKRHVQPMAKGYRRWSRTAGFSPTVRMNDYRQPPPDKPERIERVGWFHPTTAALMAFRVWLPVPEPPPPRTFPAP